jgi:hypothetical protein
MAEYLVPLGLLILYLVASRKKPKPAQPHPTPAPPTRKKVAPPILVSEPPQPPVLLAAPIPPAPQRRSRAAGLLHTRESRRKAFLAREILRPIDDK